jgi:hypothetical protein
LIIIVRTLATLALVLGGAASAQAAPAVLGKSVSVPSTPAVCAPYSIPIPSTITDCGPGMVGTKYKTSEKVCPSGEVKQSETYDTTACHTSATGANGLVTAEARCRITPGACATAPSPANCPAGRLWTLAGSGIAHCVDQDPPCAGGTVNHDALGNPTNCQTSASRTQSCGSGYTGSIKQRRAVYTWTDGRTTYGTWSTTSDTCRALPPPPPPAPMCTESDTFPRSEACPSGAGIRHWREKVTCPGGPYGSPQVSGYWDEKLCSGSGGGSTPAPTIPAPNPSPATCAPSSSTESAACTGGRSGTMYRQVSTTCPGGSYGSPSTNFGGWNESQCSNACNPTSSTSSTACGSGFSGTKYITTYYTCPSGTYQTTNDSQCGCANGANDYPKCTPPHQEPVTTPAQPSGCEDGYGSVRPIGTTVANCMIPSPANPYPRGRTYRCGTSGWLLSSPGSGTVEVYCD